MDNVKYVYLALIYSSEELLKVDTVFDKPERAFDYIEENANLLDTNEHYRVERMRVY